MCMCVSVYCLLDSPSTSAVALLTVRFPYRYEQQKKYMTLLGSFLTALQNQHSHERTQQKIQNTSKHGSVRGGALDVLDIG